ncbi:MAG: hypothetical protein GX562_05250 [Coriobacteriaceae bacterium]|nr:hypothetical protein [Coriobacteriaceae bacterium]
MSALVFCVVVPVVVMTMLAPSLQRTSPTVENFRGARVYSGLGIVWFVWLVFFWVGAHLLGALRIAQPAWISYLVPLFPLIAGSCAFGLFDDWVGNHQAKGFKGHLEAMFKGVLTTGGLKFIGIGFLSLFTAISLYWNGVGSALQVISVTCVMALSANLMNLFDLRPGRAGKMYFLGLVVALIAVGFSAAINLAGFDLAALALAALGPLVATWRFDIGERGMLGDAGANSMGAFLGYLFATALPLWALIILAIGLFAVNLLSDRVSFSALVDRNRLLSAFDQLGRGGDVSLAVSGINSESGLDSDDEVLEDQKRIATEQPQYEGEQVSVNHMVELGVESPDGFDEDKDNRE